MTEETKSIQTPLRHGTWDQTIVEGTIQPTLADVWSAYRELIGDKVTPADRDNGWFALVDPIRNGLDQDQFSPDMWKQVLEKIKSLSK